MGLDTTLPKFLRSHPGKPFRPSELRSLPEFQRFKERTISDTLRCLAQGGKVQRCNLLPRTFPNKKDWIYWS
uniref:hypothetical protein n=1 Tax=Trichocoleus desertorum TaxID=1481672 RepID=UPI0025B3EB50|nr:hypothetical protein [Trichocoleus desertorum]